MTSLTFDLTSDQEKLPKEIEKTLQGGKKDKDVYGHCKNRQWN